MKILRLYSYNFGGMLKVTGWIQTQREKNETQKFENQTRFDSWIEYIVK